LPKFQVIGPFLSVWPEQGSLNSQALDWLVILILFSLISCCLLRLIGRADPTENFGDRSQLPILYLHVNNKLKWFIFWRI